MTSVYISVDFGLLRVDLILLQACPSSTSFNLILQPSSIKHPSLSTTSEPSTLAFHRGLLEIAVRINSSTLTLLTIAL